MSVSTSPSPQIFSLYFQSFVCLSIKCRSSCRKMSAHYNRLIHAPVFFVIRQPRLVSIYRRLVELFLRLITLVSRSYFFTQSSRYSTSDLDVITRALQRLSDVIEKKRNTSHVNVRRCRGWRLYRHVLLNLTTPHTDWAIQRSVTAWRCDVRGNERDVSN